MRHRRKRGKFGVITKHRKAMFRNMVRALVTHKRITTTVRRAKAAGAFCERMITIAKAGDLNARRNLISHLGCDDTAHTLLTVIAPKFKERQGGYTRVLRLRRRDGDGAQTALLEFTVPFEVPEKTRKPKKDKSATKLGGSAAQFGGKPGKEHAEPAVEKEKPAKSKSAETEAKHEKKTSARKDKDQDDKKESEKKGGFLGALRRFLKGDDEK